MGQKNKQRIHSVVSRGEIQGAIERASDADLKDQKKFPRGSDVLIEERRTKSQTNEEELEEQSRKELASEDQGSEVGTFKKREIRSG